MAVIDGLDKLEVTVEIDARTAREIPAPNHQKVPVQPRGRSPLFRVEIDGFSGGPGKSDEGWHKRAYKPGDQSIHSFFCQQTKDEEPIQYNLKFQSLKVKNDRYLTDTRIEEDRRIAEELGTIKVCCFYANKNNEDTGDRSLMPEPGNLNNLPFIAEGALDGRYIDCYTRQPGDFAPKSSLSAQKGPESVTIRTKKPYLLNNNEDQKLSLLLRGREPVSGPSSPLSGLR
ncbi:hypothetical protein V8F33_013928 [Rhypophila sp. PSN 637]